MEDFCLKVPGKSERKGAGVISWSFKVMLQAHLYGFLFFFCGMEELYLGVSKRERIPTIVRARTTLEEAHFVL